MVEVVFQTNIKVPAHIVQEFGIGIPFRVSATDSHRIDNVAMAGLGDLIYCLPTLKLNNISLLELRALEDILLPPPNILGEYRDF